VIRRATSLPAPASTIDAAINQIRSESLPIADADAMWLARIAETHAASLDEAANLPTLARFLDTHLVLCYRNAAEWFDVHPLIRDAVTAQARALATRAAPDSAARAKARTTGSAKKRK
jgi:hypothetical protein